MSFAFPRSKLAIKPGLPTGSRSANNSPRNAKSTEHSTSEMYSFGSHQSLNKSICAGLLKNLEELGNSLDAVIKRFKNYDKDLYQLILNCENNLRLTKKKVLEMSSEDDLLKLSDSSGIQDISTIIKPDANEYCKFLEYLISYEQAKCEIIIRKTKFPKIRMQEVDKDLSEEFMLKSPSKVKIVKSNEVPFADKAKKEMTTLFGKIKGNLKKNCKMPDEMVLDMDQSIAEASIAYERSIELKNSLESLSLAENNKKLLKEKEKIEDLLGNLNKEHKKLSGKYSYLINKLNKQDCQIKFQAKLLNSISNNTFSIKQQFVQFIEEMKFYMSLLMENINAKTSGVKAILVAPGCILPKSLPNPEKFIAKIESQGRPAITSGLRFVIKDEEIDRTGWQSQVKEIDNYKGKILELEKKLKESLEKIKKYEMQQEESEDSLDLKSNVYDMIEIQKLKDQIRLLNFKSNESLTVHQKEIDTFKAQVSRIKAEKFSLEERIKALNQKIVDLGNEKENLLEEVEKYKSMAPIVTFQGLQRLSADTTPPELSSRSENATKVNADDILILINDEIDEIAGIIKQHRLIQDEKIGSLNLIKKTIEFLGVLQEETHDESQDFLCLIAKLVKNLKTKAQSFDQNAPRTDPNTFLVEKQLELYRTKLNDKKNQLNLHKQQISFLKKSVKELQAEVAKANPLDTECIKGMFSNIIKDIPSLPANTEQMVMVFMKILGFSQSEVTKITFERKSKKPTGIFKGIFH
ncbi:hypothetical protein SteCoe_20292 [Stentor coeruleus]|uniref:Uncharacterized protein n=1 Tax=Stentor coeruleus TaxID=5963 RepID=A0A1R2BSE1_9CILI|nr:hypothetical protein SteCoe_20292 [Stentor coeruleus]